jgi:precorrin-3B synthase
VVASPLERPPGLVRGACPSAHQPFAALDGALVRVRVPGGIVPASHARAIAGVAGPDGVVELTNRANLQLRAIDPGRVDDARRALVAAGVVDADGERDERRNVLASPTAGVDAAELFDTRPLVIAVDALLGSARARGLSPKFGVLLDGGGAVHVRGRAHDLALGAVLDEDGQVVLEVQLVTGLPVDGRGTSGRPLGVRPERALEVVGAVVDACARFGRASTWSDACGAASVRAVLAEAGAVPIGAVGATAESSRPVGVVAQRQPGLVLVGCLPTLGRLDGRTLDALADVADEFGTGALRTTPWRGLVVPGVGEGSARAVVDRCEALALTCDPFHPVNAVVACAGNTGCASGWRDVQHDARALLARLEGLAPHERPATVHVSGCAKGCAHPAPAAVTLVATDRGRYDLYRDDQVVARELAAEVALEAAARR